MMFLFQTDLNSNLFSLIICPEIDILGGDISEFIGDENNIIANRAVPTNDGGDIKNYMKKRCAFNHT